MRKSILTKVITVMSALLICMAIPNVSVKAYGLDVNIPLVTVTDIDNVPYPSTYDMYFFGEGYRNYSSFKISEPGEVKAYFRWGTSIKGKGTVWFSRDEEGHDIVGERIELGSKNKALTAFLDAGSYYLNAQWSSEAYEVGAALLYEKSNSEESVTVSSFFNPNIISLDRTVKGFLSETTPIDYYAFQISETANIKVTYSFDSSKATVPGLITLYDSNQVAIVSKEYGKSTRGAQTFNYLLEPGFYYVQMSDMVGNTTLNVEPMYYKINITPEVTESWVKGPLKVNIDTTIDVKEMWVVRKDVADVDIKNSEIWTRSSRNELYVPLDGTTFEATKNGTYTVRVLDIYGNYTLERIKITNIDITAPKVYGVANNKNYKVAKKITWKDSQSGTNSAKVTLNGKKLKYGTTVSKAGKYTLKLYDKVGNVRTVVFYIDYTAPTVSGVKNKATYSENKVVTFSDNLTGVKKIIVDGEEIRNTITSRRFTTGEHEIKIWDNANNYRKVTFKIVR